MNYMGNNTLNIVLYQPEIPHNTGAIGRTCVGLGAKLWLVRPLGFQLSDRLLKRAGLDYWDFLDLEIADDWNELRKKLPNWDRYFFFTKKAEKTYWDVKFQNGDVLVFGSESQGFPDSFRSNYASQCLRIPIHSGIRSLNLSVSVGICAYEAARQITLETGTEI